MVQLIDLYAEHFDPTYSAEELSLYHQGGTVDPLVRKYLELLKSCRTVIFITPCWWNSIPGMLKGVIDKVMKEGPDLSHTVTRTGIKGLLTNVQHCYVLTTSTSPTWYLRFFCGDDIQRVFVNTTLKQLALSIGSGLTLAGFPGHPRNAAKVICKKLPNIDLSKMVNTIKKLLKLWINVQGS